MSQYLSFFLAEKKYLNNRVFGKCDNKDFSLSEFEKHSITLFCRSRNSELFHAWSKQYPIHEKIMILTGEQLDNIFNILKEEKTKTIRDYELYKLTASVQNTGNKKLELLEYLKKKIDAENDEVERVMLDKILRFISDNCMEAFDRERYEETLREYESTIEEYEMTIHRIETMLEFVEHRNDNDSFEYVWFME